MIRNATAVIGRLATADLTGKDGYFVKNSSGSVALVSAVTDLPLGVVTSGDVAAGFTSVALPNFGGTVSVKLNGTPGTVVQGTDLYLKADGTVAVLPVAAGTYYKVAIALESGAANELIEARLVEPTTKVVS